MAFFKLRPGSQTGTEESASGAENSTIDALRRKARQRLIGAAVLVVLAVVGFPLIFDTQPRPVQTDLAIEIPSQSKVASDTPVAPVAPAAGGAGDAPNKPEPQSAPSAVETKKTLADKEEIIAPGSASVPVASSAAAPVASAPVTTPAPKTDAKPEGKADPNTAAKAQAKPDNGEHRYAVQVGAFNDESKVRETRSKLERAGLKTYTQVVNAKDGKRTRVRLGPFVSKAEAEAAAEKVKALQLPAIVLDFSGSRP
jgi:DedD protein